MKNAVRYVLFRIIALLNPKRFAASRPVEGNAYYYHGKRGRSWWNFKYLLPVENPEPGSGIEEYFASRTFDLSPPDGFVPETEATLAVAGDVLPLPSLREGGAEHLWDEIEDFFFSADIRYANLESPISLSKQANFSIRPPLLNNTPEWFDRCWRDGRGIDLFSTANNHSLDMGREGLLETLDFLDSRGATHVGTARSDAERDAFPILERNGIKFAFLSYTFSLNLQQNPPGKGYLANHLRLNVPEPDLGPILRQVELARERGADVVVALLHWSLEFESFPIRHIVDTGHRLLESGVDIIVGNHSHGVQPVEVYEFQDSVTNEEKKGLIFYALGDLISWHMTPNSRLTAVACVRLQKGRFKDKETVLVTGVEIKPLYSFVELDGDDVKDICLFDIAALSNRLENGSETPPLTKKQRKEVLRLHRLAERVIPGAFRKFM